MFENKSKQEIILLYLESIVEKYSVNDELHDHSKPKQVFVWIIAVSFGALSFGFAPSVFTLIIITASFVLVSLGTMTFKRKNYDWFIYYIYNICGSTISVMNLFWSDAFLYDRNSLIELIVIFFSLFALSCFVSHIVMNMVILRTTRIGVIENISKNTGLLLASIGAIIGLKVSSHIPEENQIVFLMISTGAIVGAFNSIIGTIYYYGKKYDPQCKLIKSI